ncbi:hypothetical protein [Comamonas thiooxydans]|uniref:hypothetical protein n=1 Tax=Comamonas thiooxydans TaxID=363952 RepID=UPI00050F1990|nr:hypothetical protein [Comamonas thiooxydans]KGH18128.1 hypothetical protein P606_25180 [Comamonas thiooxydans]
MNDKNELPQHETMSFLTEAEAQHVYLALELAKRAYKGDSEAALKDLRNDPVQFATTAQHYICKKPPSVLKMQLLHGAVALAITVILLFSPFDLIWSDWLIGTLAICFALSKVVGLQKNLKGMAAQLQMVLQGLQTKPDQLDSKALAMYVDKHAPLKKLAAELGAASSMTMKELVLLKACELRILLGRPL